VSSLLRAACCCGGAGCIDCSCLPSSVTIDCPSFTADSTGEDCSLCGGAVAYPVIPATTVTAYLCCSTDSYAYYRANAIQVDDANFCCGSPAVCTNHELWVVFFVVATCAVEGGVPVFVGWQVGADFVVAREICGQCATVTPRDLSVDPCAGSADFSNIPYDSWFTCTSTCTLPGCVALAGAATLLNTSGGSDPCDPTGTYPADYDITSIGNIVVS